MRVCYRIAILLNLLFFQHNLAAQNVVSDFSANADGWTIFNMSSGANAGAAHYNAAGGNPGGYIDDGGTISGPVILSLEAPGKFIGNKSSSYGLNLKFDIKEDLVGTDNNYADVFIQNGGSGSLFYQMPTKPTASFPASSPSYTIQLKETFAGWHFGSTIGPAPTKEQMKLVLSNITALRIRTKHTTANTFTVVGSIDNVVLEVPTLSTPPVITSISPLSALKGASVTITGTNFSSSAAQNNVFFNGVKAVVTFATATQLIATVPTSAVPGPITVINAVTGLQGVSKQRFNLLFDNNKDYGGTIIPASMLRGNSTFISMPNNSNSFGSIEKGDFDGDGWVDLIVTETATTKIFAYRNLASGGTVTAASFGSPLTLPSFSSVPNGGATLTQMRVADFDSDGKLDVAAIVPANAGIAYFAIFQNTSTPGTISFAAPQYFALPFYSSIVLHASDIDADGRIDLLAVTGTSPSNLYVSRNQSTPGNIDFAFGQIFGANTGYAGIGTADMDNDGKNDVMLAYSNGFIFLTNASTPGTISLTSGFTLTNTSASGVTNFKVVDIDNDLNPDLIWTVNTGNIYVKANLYSGGALTAASFSSDFVFSSSVNTTANLDVGDINSDGKADIVVVGLYDMGIFQNVGSGSMNASYFLPGRLFQGSAGGGILSNLGPLIADLDGDNKAEVIMSYSASGANTPEKGIYIFHNESYPLPSISNLSPPSGGLASAIKINGTLMNTGAATSPIVRVGTTLASSTPAGNAETDFTVPLGAISDKITYTNHGLIAKSAPFAYTFNTNRVINSSTFPSSVDFALTGTVRDVITLADLDDDGRTDVMATENFSNLRIFQNSHATAGNPITSASLTELGTTLTGGGSSMAYDIDGDGKTDVLSGFGLYRNSSAAGSIAFGSIVSSGSTTFLRSAVADFNKDGKLDYAGTNSGANITISENLSSRGNFVAVQNTYTFGPTFTNLPTGSNSLGVVAADFDGDGSDDLITVNQTPNSMSIYLNNRLSGPITTGSFTYMGDYSVAGTTPNGLVASDFDGDGGIDIAISYFNSPFVSVYLNRNVAGDISFASPVNLPALNKGYDLAAKDLDGDGAAEIVVIHQPNPGPGSFTIFKNNSVSGFANFATGVNFPLTRNPQAIAIADINSDTKPDILIVGNSGSSGPPNALSIFENKITTPTITITTQPADVTVCKFGTGTFTVAATGTTNITYQWQFALTSSGPFNDISNGGGYSGATTSTLTVNSLGNFGAGRYRCKIGGDFAATVFSNDEGFFISNTACPATIGITSQPTDVTVCKFATGTFSIIATGTTNMTYQWQFATTSTAPFTDVVNGGGYSGATTNSLTVNSTGNFGAGRYRCKVGGDFAATVFSNDVGFTIGNTLCANAAPVIQSATLATTVGGVASISLANLISDADNNLDLSTLAIIKPPSSGATAMIKPDRTLLLDYSGVRFAGTDNLTIQVCDLAGSCTQQQIIITVSGEIVIYNAVSSNGDGRNDIFYIENIDSLPETKKNTVTIFNRWGAVVFETSDYDNVNRAFRGVNQNGAELPVGTYFYKIVFSSGIETKTGFLSLRK